MKILTRRVSTCLLGTFLYFIPIHMFAQVGFGVLPSMDQRVEGYLWNVALPLAGIVIGVLLLLILFVKIHARRNQKDIGKWLSTLYPLLLITLTYFGVWLVIVTILRSFNLNVTVEAPPGTPEFKPIPLEELGDDYVPPKIYVTPPTVVQRMVFWNQFKLNILKNLPIFAVIYSFVTLWLYVRYFKNPLYIKRKVWVSVVWVVLGVIFLTVVPPLLSILLVVVF